MAPRSARAQAVGGALLVAGALSLCPRPAFLQPAPLAGSEYALQQSFSPEQPTWGNTEAMLSRPSQRMPAARAPRPAVAIVAMVEMQKPEQGLSGKIREALLTAWAAGCGVFVCSVLALVFHEPLWVPPFGALALIFGADAKDAAKKGVALSIKDTWAKAAKNLVSVFLGGCLTVVLTWLFGAQPAGRAIVIGGVGMMMGLVPLCGWFPSAGGLAGLYLNEVLRHGPLALQGHMAFRFAVAPCFAGTLLMLVSTRIAAAILGAVLRTRFRFAMIRTDLEAEAETEAASKKELVKA